LQNAAKVSQHHRAALDLIFYAQSLEIGERGYLSVAGRSDDVVALVYE